MEEIVMEVFIGSGGTISLDGNFIHESLRLGGNLASQSILDRGYVRYIKT